MVSQAARRYPVDILHDLRKTLPSVKCDLSKFSADAWRSQLIKPPIPFKEQVIFPADFPKVARRKRSEIPDQRIPVGVSNKTAPGEGPVDSERKPEKKRPVLPALVLYQASAVQRHAGFEHFLETVPSPTNKRVTAGGRVVPAQPGCVSPVASKATPFVPPHIAALEASPLLVQSNPGLPPVLYQPIGPVAALHHHTYEHSPPAETIAVTTPPSGIPSVPAQKQSSHQAAQPSNTAGNNLANPLINVTNRPKAPYPEYEWERRVILLQQHANQVYADMERYAGVDDELYALRKVEYHAILEEIDRLSEGIKDSQRKRSRALQEQSMRSRLNRVNGTEPDSDMVKQNHGWWTNQLMSDSGAFLSHAQSLRHKPVTEADLNEIKRYLENTAQENMGWLGNRSDVEQSAISVPLSKTLPQSTVGGSRYHGAGSGHMFGLDGGASLPDEGESNQPTSEDLLTELQPAPEMSGTSFGYVNVARRRETDPFHRQFSPIDSYQGSYQQTLSEKLYSPHKVELTHGGVGDKNTTTENRKARADFENKRGGNPLKAAPSVSSDLNTNFTELSISTTSQPNTDRLLKSSRYMKTVNSKGDIKTVPRTKSAEADLLKSHIKLSRKAMCPEYRNALDEERVKKLKDTENQKAYINAMMKNPRLSGKLDPEQFSQAVSRELEKRQERARALNAILEDIEPSVRGDLGQALQPKKDSDVSWSTNLQGGSKEGVLIDLGDSEDDKATDKKTNAGSVTQGEQSLMDADIEEVLQPTKAPKHEKMGESSKGGEPSKGNNTDNPDPDKVDAFFDNLRREEEEEIAKYRAENPL